VFVQYSPLLRLQPIVSKAVVSLHSFMFLVAVLNEGIGLLGVGIVSAIVLPLYGAWFLVKAGNTTGKLTLAIHIVSGVFALTVAFLVNLLVLWSSEFRDEPVVRTFEVTVVGCFAIFQTIFHMGESTDESEVPIGKREVHRYEAIEELLEGLTHMDEDIKFDVPQG
jgi:hypothetical protein